MLAVEVNCSLPAAFATSTEAMSIAVYVESSESYEKVPEAVAPSEKVALTE